MNQTAYKFQFVHPTRCIISGPSSSGKTYFMQNVIKYHNELFTESLEDIIYTYKYRQSWFDDFPYVKFIKDIPQTLKPKTLIVIDDLVCDKKSLKDSASLFVRGSHHLDASVFFITQNLFDNTSEYRTIALNANQFVLFKTIRGVHQIERLARQICDRNQVSDFMNAYKTATAKPYSYLLVDLEPTQTYRLRSNILPYEQEFVYILE